MLAVLDAKLAARGSSNGARKPSSNACASSNGVRIDFSSFLLRSWKARTSIFVSQCSVSYTSHEVYTERAWVTENHENDFFRPQNRAREPRNPARATLGERKIVPEHAKCLRIFKSRAERAGQSAERAHVGAEIDDPPPNHPNRHLGTSDRIYKDR